MHFGMTTRRFSERLWQVIPESNCAQDEIHILVSAYHPHRRTGCAAADGPVGPNNLRTKKTT